MLNLIDKIAESKYYFFFTTLVVLPIDGYIAVNNPLLGVALILMQAPYLYNVYLGKSK